MKTRHATRHKRRRSHDEATSFAASEREATPSLEQSMDLLRHPQADSATRSTAAANLQRSVGNGQVARMLARREGAGESIQRYAVGAAKNASCSDVIQWIDGNSPYQPEWAHTSVKFRWSGGFNISGNAEKGWTLKVSNPNVSMTKGVDMPEWSPSDKAMKAAWQKAYGILRTHEAKHEGIGTRWQKELLARLKALSLSVQADTKAEVTAQAQALIEAEWNAWVAEQQAEQDSIDPFTAPLVCPPVKQDADEE